MSEESVGKPTTDKGEVSPRNTLNDLTAKEWLPETVSVWTQRGLGANHPDAQIERQHPAPFSFTDVSRLINFFTKKNGLVLDPFVGVGSTLKACAVTGRRGIGVELNSTYVGLSKERLEKELEPSLFPAPEQRIIEGDARDVLPTLDFESLDFVVTSPPYWSILHKEDHKAKQVRTDHGLETRYSQDDPRDFGNIVDYEDFVRDLSGCLGLCSKLLRPKKYMAVVVGDFRHGGKYYMFHADLAAALEPYGFALHGLKVIYQRHKRVFPYGYPSSYVPNLHHQYVLILRAQP